MRLRLALWLVFFVIANARHKHKGGYRARQRKKLADVSEIFDPTVEKVEVKATKSFQGDLYLPQKLLQVYSPMLDDEQRSQILGHYTQLLGKRHEASGASSPIGHILQLAMLLLAQRKWAKAERLLKQAALTDPFSGKIQRLLYFSREGMNLVGSNGPRVKLEATPHAVSQGFLGDALGLAPPLDLLRSHEDPSIPEWKPPASAASTYNHSAVEAAVDILAIHELQTMVAAHALPQLAALSLSFAEAQGSTGVGMVADNPLLTRGVYAKHKRLLLRSALCPEITMVLQSYVSAVHKEAAAAGTVVKNDKTALFVARYTKPLVEAVVGKRLQVAGVEWVRAGDTFAPVEAEASASAGSDEGHTLTVAVDWEPKEKDAVAGVASSTSPCVGIFQSIFPNTLNTVASGDGWLSASRVSGKRLTVKGSDPGTCALLILHFR